MNLRLFWYRHPGVGVVLTVMLFTSYSLASRALGASAPHVGSNSDMNVVALLAERAAVGSGGWTRQAPLGATATPPTLIQVQCPSTTVCYAAGSPDVGNPGYSQGNPVFQRTTDGGALWSSQRLNIKPYNGSDASASLSCPSVTRCYLLANTSGLQDPQNPPKIWVTTDGGQTWTKHRVGNIQTLQQIVCPSTRVCYVSAFLPGQAAHEDILITRNGGATWNRRTLTVTDQPLLALACPGINDCYLSGSQMGPRRLPGIALTHDGGRTWRIPTSTVAHPTQYRSLACPTVSQCYAVGTSNLASTNDGGSTWTNRKLPVAETYGSLQPITCATATICYLLELGRLWRTTDGGAAWMQALIGSSAAYLLDIACPAPGACYGVGYESMILKSTDGLSWQEPTAYTRNGLSAIACPSPTTCYAVGGSGTVLTTTNGGVTWVRRSSGTSADLTSVACPALDVCLAGALPLGLPGGFVLKTTDGGRTWRMEKQGIRALSIACPSVTVCFAAGGAVLRTDDGGGTWTIQSLPKGNGLASIACPTTQRCVGVGGVPPCDTGTAAQCTGHGWLFMTTDAGRHWRRQMNGREALISVACPIATQCYAGGYGIWARSMNSGRSWVVTHSDFAVSTIVPALPCTPAPGLFVCSVKSLSCTSLSTCWGVAGLSTTGIPVRTTDGGRSWQSIARNVPVPTLFTVTGLFSLACPRANRCFATGPGGLIMAYSVRSSQLASRRQK